MRRRLSRIALGATALLLSATLAACGGTPTDTPAPEASPTAVDTASAEAARYAAQDPLASTDELSSYARSCVGHDDLVVSVDDAIVSVEPTEVRVMDSEGTWREAEASVSRRTRRVTASLDVKLVGGLGTWTVRASHASVSSEVS